MLKKKNSSELSSSKSSSFSAEHRESKRSKFSFPRAFRAKQSAESSISSPTASSSSSYQSHVVPTTPPNEIPVTPVGTPPPLPTTVPPFETPLLLVGTSSPLPSTTLPVTPTNSSSLTIAGSETISGLPAKGNPSESSESQNVLPDQFLDNSGNVSEKLRDCKSVDATKLPLLPPRSPRRKLSAGDRHTVRFDIMDEDRSKTTRFPGITNDRPHSVAGPAVRSKETMSEEILNDHSDYDDDEEPEQSPKTRKGSLPSVYDPSPLQRVNPGATRKTFSSNNHTPMTKESSFTVKYVRVHGPEDGAYKNDSKPRGLIFMKNVESFDDNQYSFRHGSAVDYCNLLELFQQMGYRKSQKYCETGHITKKKLLDDLKAFSKLDHSRYDSCIIILMSHGVRDKTFVCSDGELVDLMDVYSMFNNTNCHHLRNKPKIFILQFCRPQGTLPDTRRAISLRNLTNVNTLAEIDLIDLKIRDAVDRMAEQLRLEFRAAFEEKFGNLCGSQTSAIAYGSEHSESSVFNDVEPPTPNASSTPKPGSFRTYDKNLYYSSSFASAATNSPYPLSAASTSYASAFSFDHPHLLVDAAKHDASNEDIPAPDYSDMYSIFSTNSGGVAYRHPKKGSLLVQAICHVFSSHSYQDDIEELVRKVSKWMQQEIAKDDPMAITRNTAVERVNNGLDKAFYFNPTVLRNVKRMTTVFW